MLAQMRHKCVQQQLLDNVAYKFSKHNCPLARFEDFFSKSRLLSYA